jgi:hypothetical protein
MEVRVRFLPSEVLSYVNFNMPQSFRSLNICLLFSVRGILKNKHESNVNENIVLALVYKDTFKAKINSV